jgi:cytochrome c peroxidase
MIERRWIVLVSLTIAVLGTVSFLALAVDLTPEQQLGKSIFFDENLSMNHNQACAACHGPQVGWTGPSPSINAHGAVYEGSIPGRFGARKPPSAAYATPSPVLYLHRGDWIGGNFWDGRATGRKLGNPAADQAQGPFLAGAEQALPDSACVVRRVCDAPYPVLFTDVWGSDACAIAWPPDTDAICAMEGNLVPLSPENRVKSNAAYDQIALSIASYEGSSEVNAFSSKYDQSINTKFQPLKKGTALTQLERKGFSLFKGKAGCKACHPVEGMKALLTDYTYDNLGLPKNPENPVYDYDPAFIDQGLGGFLRAAGEPTSVWEEEVGKVKVPTLRNVDLRPSAAVVKAYGHNGYFKTLKGIVHFYNTRDVLPVCPGDFTEMQAMQSNCWPPPEVPETVNDDELGNLRLSDEEEDAIVAFLRTLSDGFVPGSAVIGQDWEVSADE